MSSEVKTIRQTLRVTDVEAVTVSAVVDSDVPGQKLRTIRVHGPGGTANPPVFELQIEAADPADLAVPTPQLRF